MSVGWWTEKGWNYHRIIKKRVKIWYENRKELIDHGAGTQQYIWV